MNLQKMHSDHWIKHILKIGLILLLSLHISACGQSLWPEIPKNVINNTQKPTPHTANPPNIVTDLTKPQPVSDLETHIIKLRSSLKHLQNRYDTEIASFQQLQINGENEVTDRQQRLTLDKLERLSSDVSVQNAYARYILSLIHAQIDQSYTLLRPKNEINELMLLSQQSDRLLMQTQELLNFIRLDMASINRGLNIEHTRLKAQSKHGQHKQKTSSIYQDPQDEALVILNFYQKDLDYHTPLKQIIAQALTIAPDIGFLLKAYHHDQKSKINTQEQIQKLKHDLLQFGIEKQKIKIEITQNPDEQIQSLPSFGIFKIYLD
ncbi:MAG: hypothetical protein AAF403_02105 [Pseudomonadota bacterium]